MSGFEGEVLVTQLAQLGRDLDGMVKHLGELDDYATEREGEYRYALEEHEDRLAEAFLAAEGSVDARKCTARLKCTATRVIAGEAALEWNRAKSRLRTHQASIQALHRRIEIGRSMLSREKALMTISEIGHP